jgi:hypothetical protein
MKFGKSALGGKSLYAIISFDVFTIVDFMTVD